MTGKPEPVAETAAGGRPCVTCEQAIKDGQEWSETGFGPAHRPCPDRELPLAGPIMTETTRRLVRRLSSERRRARQESGRRQQQATLSMALVRSFASAVGVRMPNYMSTFGPKPHEYDACRAAALRLRADLIDARAELATVRPMVLAAIAYADSTAEPTDTPHEDALLDAVNAYRATS